MTERNPASARDPLQSDLKLKANGNKEQAIEIEKIEGLPEPEVAINLIHEERAELAVEDDDSNVSSV